MKPSLPRLAFVALLALTAQSLAKEPAAAPALAQESAVSPPILPDPELTPGDTLEVTLADIQEKGYSKKVRNVPVAVKREVYNSYGIEHWEKGEYEIDHLISLSLGGSNSKKNLWPQSYQTQPWNAHTKDQLEVKLLKLVREGKVDLHEAQAAMAKDWIKAYKKYVSPEPTAHREKATPKDEAAIANAEKDEDPDNTAAAPASKPSRSARKGAAAADATPPPAPESSSAPGAAPARSASAAGDDEHAGQVWVNTKSGTIWKAGSQFYGKTKAGKFMTPEEAKAAGYHYAGGKE